MTNEELIEKLVASEAKTYAMELDALRTLREYLGEIMETPEPTEQQYKDLFTSAANEAMKMAHVLHTVKTITFEGYEMPEHMLLWADMIDTIYGTSYHPKNVATDD